MHEARHAATDVVIHDDDPPVEARAKHVAVDAVTYDDITPTEVRAYHLTVDVVIHGDPPPMPDHAHHIVTDVATYDDTVPTEARTYHLTTDVVTAEPPIEITPDLAIITVEAISTPVQYEPVSLLARSIDAPDTLVEYNNSLTMRFYSGSVSPDNATLSNPVGHSSAYGLIWTTPGRGANRYRNPASTDIATSTLDGTKEGYLVAHTMVLKPLDPEAVPDDDLLKPPEERAPQKVWFTASGSFNEKPGVEGDWVEQEVQFWQVDGINVVTQEPYAEGDAVFHNGRTWVATSDPELGGEPGVDPAWQLVEAWDENTVYPAGSYVTDGNRAPGTTPGGIGGGAGDDDRFQVGRTGQGDILQPFLRGVAWDTSHQVLWAVDANNSILIQSPNFGFWYDHSNLNPNGHPDVESTTDLGFWQLRDATYDGTFFWVLRRSDATLLKYQLPFFGAMGSRTILEAVPIATIAPSGLAWDGIQMWVNSQTNQRIELLTAAGLIDDTISHPWTTNTLSGFGHDPDGGLWITDPATFLLQKVDPQTGEVLSTRGWDANFQAPQSAARQPGTNILWVVSAQWIHRIFLPEDVEVIQVLSVESFRHPILWEKLYLPGDLW